MAKISARGDRAFRRWTQGVGTHLVLTEQGRLLRKGKFDSTYKLVGRKTDIEAQAYAERYGWERA